MRKSLIYIVLLAVSMSLLLSGCIQIDIDTGIDADFTAFLSYHIVMDVSETDPHKSVFANAIHRIGWYYQEELGFIVQVNTEDAPFELIMTRRVENNSFEQAFQSLEDMLTNEDISPFMMVDMAYEDFPREKTFFISAMADIPQIMRLSSAQDLTPDMQQELQDALETGSGAITVALPASELVSASLTADIQNNRAVMVVPLVFTEQVSFDMATRLNYLSSGEVGGSFDEIIEEIDHLRSISVIVSGAALILLLIVILLLVIKARRRRKYRGM